jgi:hypothetical protein
VVEAGAAELGAGAGAAAGAGVVVVAGVCFEQLPVIKANTNKAKTVISNIFFIAYQSP